ncbi:hypothetical protein ACFYNL_38610 [Streptomyces sp. NPDC007808]|uniref:hypothetical protein n=1 Tax=Streptomyces sp. NPDC007808 TaxID=3364779 RepID=UPI003695EB90
MQHSVIRTLGPAVVLGKAVAWGACTLMTVLLGCWLFMVKSTMRDALVLGCAGALAVLAVSAWALRRASGNAEPAEVYRALADRLSRAGENDPGELPGRLRGASALWNNEALVVYGAVVALILPLALGVGEATPSGKAADIASAGAVVRALPVESVRDVVEDEHRNGSTYHCTVTVTVTLPAADEAGRGQRVDFRSEFPDPAVVGAKVYVAHAPDRPELGAVGDNDRADVERRLTGRAMSNWWTWILALAWLVLVVTITFGRLTTRRDQRFPRRLRGNESVLRARVSGYDGYGAGKARISLDIADGVNGPVQLHVPADNARYVETVGRAEGHLVWVPGRNRHGSRKGPHRTGAVFVGDAGWFIPGGLAPEHEETASARGDHQVPVNPGSEGRLLDLNGCWILSIPNRSMNVLLLWTLSVVVLALPAPGVAWRLVIGIVGTVGLLAYGMYLAVRHDPASERQSGGGRGAMGAAA